MNAEVFKDWFAVPPAAARVVAALYAAGGFHVSSAFLASTTQQSPNNIRNCIMALRGAMDHGAIESEQGVGYRLTMIGRADCARTLADAATRERAAA